MTKVVFPSFSTDDFRPYEMRQLVSALELRFQSLEEDTDPTFITETGLELDPRYAAADHTHLESQITDLQNYLTNINTESIFDLSDVTGTPSPNDVLVWNGTAFVPGSSGSVTLELDQLTDVSVPAPLDTQVLTYVEANSRWEAGSTVGLTSLADLTDTDLIGQGAFDLLFNADGTEWQDTNGELQWNPALDYLQLANAHSINWLDVAGTSSVELAQFESVGVVGTEIEHGFLEIADHTGITSTTYINITGGTIAGSTFTVGDEYLVLCQSHLSCSSSLAVGNGIRLQLNGATIAGAEINQENSNVINDGWPMQCLGKFTYASGDLVLQGKVNATSGTARVSASTIMYINLTELGASNYEWSTSSGVVEFDDVSWSLTGAAVTFGNGVDDYLVIGAMQLDNFSFNATLTELGFSDGTTDYEKTAFECEVTSETHTAMFSHVAEAPASATWTLQGQVITASRTSDCINASIIAIRLNAFTQHEILQVADITDPTASGEQDIMGPDSFTAGTGGNWGFWGGLRQTYASSSTYGETELQMQEDAGGYSAVTWDVTDRRIADNQLNNTKYVQTLFYPTTETSVSASGAIDVKMVHDAQSNPTNNDLFEGFILSHTWVSETTAAETFSVGDPAYKTIIDGLTVEVTGPTTISATLNATGATTLDSTLDVLGTLSADKVIAGDPGTEGSGIQINGTLYESVLKASDIGGTNAAQFIMHRHSTTLPAAIVGARASDDTTGHTIVADNDVLLGIYAAGWDGLDSYSLSSAIDFQVDGTPGTDDMPGQISFYTSADGTETLIERMRVRADGSFEIVDPGGTDWVSFLHDGTDLNITTTNTSSINFATGASVEFNDNVLIYGTDITFWSPDLSKIATMSIGNDGVFDFFDISGLTDFYFEGNVVAREGSSVTIYDSTNTDFGAFSHDGDDFNTAFTTTTDWNITGIAGFNVGNYNFDVDQTVGAGQDNYVLTYDMTGGLISLEALPASGSGTVTSATQAENQLAVWTAVADEIEGDSNLTWDASTLSVGGELYITGDNAFRIEGSTSGIYTEFDRLTSVLNVTPSGAGNGFHLLNGSDLRVYDNTDTDYASFSHDTTDFNTAFATTTDWNVGSGLTGVVSFDRPISAFASTATEAGLNLPEGSTPSSPVDGDIWITATGGFVRINGTSYNWAGGTFNDMQPAQFNGVTDQTLTSTTITIDLATETYDPDGKYSVASDVVTIDDAGYYQISYGVFTVVASGSGNTQCAASARITKNGTATVIAGSESSGYLNEANNPIDGHNLSSVFMHRFAASDTIRIRAELNQNTDVDTVASKTFLYITKIRQD